MAELNYQSETNEEMSDFVAIPVPLGKYYAIIERSEVNPTKNNDGKHLDLYIQVIDGPFKGKKIFRLLNYDNPNGDARIIAQKEINSIKMALFGDLRDIKNSELLHNIPFIIEIGSRINKNTKESELYVKKYTKIEGGTSVPSQPEQVNNSPQSAKEPAPSAEKKHPWET